LNKFIRKAPLFLAVYISLAVMFLVSQYENPLKHYFPGFAEIVQRLAEDTIYVANLIDVNLIDPRREQNTVHVTGVTLDIENLEDLSIDDNPGGILAVTEEPEPETDPVFVPIPSDGSYTPRDSFGTLTEGPVDESYFDDAVFIGDSRTVGLSMYSNFENADYLCDVGMNIYDCMDRDISFKGNEHTSVREMLSARSYRKVYMMLGINEIGTGTADSFCEEYSNVISEIQAYQPNAIIVIQSIMCVGKSKSDSHRTINNPRIYERNEKLKTLANNTNIYYLNINEAIADENGNMPANYSFDQVHLYAQYYYLWRDYLLQHGLR